MTLKELLNQEPNPKDIMIRDGAEYIPIGVVETYLDDLDHWSIKSFLYTKESDNVYSGSILLYVLHGDDYKTTVGSCTYHADPNSPNKNHISTLESYCVANAAKRMGKRFGRHFNNRMLGSEETGNTIPNIQVDKPEETTEDLTSYTKKLNLPNV